MSSNVWGQYICENSLNSPDKPDKVDSHLSFSDEQKYKQLYIRVLLLLFSHLIVSNSLQSHWLQHTRPPCPSLTPRVCPSSCSLHWWCCSAISSSDSLFSFCPQYFPASGTFPMNRLFTSDDRNSGASASASVLPVNIQCWSPLRLAGFISLLSKGFQESSPGQQFKGINSLGFWFLYSPALTTLHDHWEGHSFDIGTFVSRVMSLLFNTLSRFVIAFLPRSSHLLISWI